MEVIGNLNVGNILTARRGNNGANSETITTTRTIDINDYQWLNIINASTQDIVLPDATTLPLGWNITINVPPISGASVHVKSYHISSPVLVKNILPDFAYTFTCVNIGTSAGEWQVSFLYESNLVSNPRFESTFNGTTDWGVAGGGFYTIEVTAITHGRGTMPTVQTEKLTGSDYYKVDTDRCLILANGDVQIRVQDSPDLRFAGRLLFT